MKISTFVYGLVIGCLISFHSLPASIVKNEKFFEQVKAYNLANYPESMSALLKSTVVSFQFRNIPKDAIELGKEPELFLKFKRGYAPILVVESVSSFYANFFAPYEAIIQKSGMFLGIDDISNYRQFKKEYRFKVNTIQEGFKVNIREREGLPGDYAEYRFRKDHSIFRAYFYEEKVMTGEIKFFYKKHEKRNLPSRIIIILHKKLQGGMKEFFVDFESFDFKKLSNKLF